MFKILSAVGYSGVFKDSKGIEHPYSKTLLVVSQNGNYPRLINVENEVFKNCIDNYGKDILNRDCDLLGKYEYGKYKVKEIKF